MRFVLGADEDRPILLVIETRLRERGHEVTRLPIQLWGVVGSDVAKRVVDGEFDQGIVVCFTGTGVSIAANKIRGARAALCTDAETARGAKKWNDANVLAMSFRLLSESLAHEILDAWTSTGYEGSENVSLKAMGEAE